MKRNCWSFRLIQLLLIGFYGTAQQTEIVDFIRTEAVIEPVVSEKKVLGKVSYTFKVLKKCDSIFLDGVGIILLKVNSKNNISISSANKKIWLVSNFKTDNTYTISFNYEATPKKALPCGDGARSFAVSTHDSLILSKT